MFHAISDGSVQQINPRYPSTGRTSRGGRPSEMGSLENIERNSTNANVRRSGSDREEFSDGGHVDDSMMSPSDGLYNGLDEDNQRPNARHSVNSNNIKG